MEEALEKEEIRNEEDNKEQEIPNTNEEPKKEKTVKISTDLRRLRDYMLYSSLSEKMNYLKSILNETQ